MKLADLVQSRDGSLSLTKLAAATAHLLMALAFARITLKQGFVSDLWLIYGGFAIGHATVDKVAAQVKSFKDAQLKGQP